MSERPDQSDIHVRLPLAHKRRLQALANTLSKRTAGRHAATGPLTVSGQVRAGVVALLNDRTDILGQDKHEPESQGTGRGPRSRPAQR